MASKVYRFGDFRLNPASRELRRGEVELSLPRKVFDCVLFLIEQRERAVERDEIFAAVWGDVQLSDSVLDQTISEARRALGDTSDEQRFIKTIRRFGYHWVAPVEVLEAPAALGSSLDRTGVRLGTALVLLVVVAVAGAAVYLSHGPDAHERAPEAVAVGEGEIALLLPVTVESTEHHAWIRLGVMDLIAERLRAAGLPMVPGDTVIAMLRGATSTPDPEELSVLASTTGARLVLAAEARTTGEQWRVVLRTLLGTEPPLSTVGQGVDVLDAARSAADRMALSLGHTPAPEPTTEPALVVLRQQVEAAIQASQMEVARTLIEEADPALRSHPEIRYRLARIDHLSGDLDAARTAFASILAAIPADREPALRARVLHSLGVAHLQKQDLDAAEAPLNEAAHLLAREADTSSLLGRIRGSLGTLDLLRDDIDRAGEHLAQARLVCQGTGDLACLGAAHHALGMLALRRERLDESLHDLERAAEAQAAVHHVANELRARSALLGVHLERLDLQAASAIEPRLNELVAQTANPRLRASARRVRALLLSDSGQVQAAEDLLSELWNEEVLREDPEGRMVTLFLRAELAARAGDTDRAARLAGDLVASWQPERGWWDIHLGHALLLLIRGRLAADRLAAASEALEAMSDWAEKSLIPSAQVYAALARAEVAAAEGRDGVARTAFDEALTLADAARIPRRVFEVADAYVSWLLAERRRGAADVERAVAVAGFVARHADRHYGAALLQLRATHAAGIAPAWRAALKNAQSLAGEREVPTELLSAPQEIRAAARH